MNIPKRMVLKFNMTKRGRERQRERERPGETRRDPERPGETRRAVSVPSPWHRDEGPEANHNLALFGKLKSPVHKTESFRG